MFWCRQRLLCVIFVVNLLLLAHHFPLQEEEAEQMMAPEDFVSEEERLRQEREAAFAAEAAEVSEAVRLHTSKRVLSAQHSAYSMRPVSVWLLHSAEIRRPVRMPCKQACAPSVGEHGPFTPCATRPSCCRQAVIALRLCRPISAVRS